MADFLERLAQRAVGELGGSSEHRPVFPIASQAAATDTVREATIDDEPMRQYSESPGATIEPISLLRSRCDSEDQPRVARPRGDRDRPQSTTIVREVSRTDRASTPKPIVRALGT